MLKKRFPYWIHILLGVIWIIIGITTQEGYLQLLWIGIGVIMVVIGLLNKKAA